MKMAHDQLRTVGFIYSRCEFPLCGDWTSSVSATAAKFNSSDHSSLFSSLTAKMNQYPETPFRLDRDYINARMREVKEKRPKPAPESMARDRLTK
jgi:hypothetical protein